MALYQKIKMSILYNYNLITYHNPIMLGCVDTKEHTADTPTAENPIQNK